MMRADELIGADLDYWVARAEGMQHVRINRDAEPNACSMWESERGLCSGDAYSPSTDWGQAGPIIEREMIHLSPPTARVHRHGGPNAGWGPSGVWSACTWAKPRAIAHHETSPLVAAMRCYVRSKFGEVLP